MQDTPAHKTLHAGLSPKSRRPLSNFVVIETYHSKSSDISLPFNENRVKTVVLSKYTHVTYMQADDRQTKTDNIS